MGYEYSIKCSVDGAEDIRDILQALPHFAGTERPGERDQAHLYRRPENDGQLPNALIEITPGGFYFCDYGEGLDILKEFVFRLALHGGPVQVIDHNE
ncbi:MAG: hypothetical protein R3B94_09290 [Hyphomonas sp.]